VKSTDYGQTWTSITGNLPGRRPGAGRARTSAAAEPALRRHRVRRLLHDRRRRSLDAAEERDCPAFRCTTFRFRRAPTILVLGTHGRGVYILDDITPLENLAKAKQAAVAYLFPVEDRLLFQPNNSRNSGMGTRGFSGQNPDPGARISYLLSNVPGDAKVVALGARRERRVVRALPVNKQVGMYRTTWDMRVGPPLTGPV
jgi:hypothetical protein